MAFTKINAAGIGSTETVTVDGLDVINNGSFGGTLSVSGSVSVGGTLTYEDVTNVDSVGLITARSGIVVGSGITLSPDGDIFTTGISTFGGNIQMSVENPEIQMNVGGPRFRVPSANTLTIHSGAALGSADEERVRFSAGRVGINTINPQYPLDLRTDADLASGIIQIVRNNTENGNGSFYATDIAQVGNFSFGMPDNTNAFVIIDGLGNDGTERLRINSDGLVGIGTDNPDSSLTVGASANPSIAFKDYTNNARAAITCGSLGQLVFQTDIDNGSANSDFVFRADGAAATSEIVRFKNTGNVGLGTDNPASKLTVSGTSGTTQIEIKRLNSNATGTVGALNFTAMDGHSVANISATADGDNEGAHLVFRTTSAAGELSPFGGSTIERLRIAADGHVGIGTQVPASMLHISAGTSGDCVLILESDEDNTGSEHDNPYMLFRQDGGIDISAIGMNPYGVAADNNVLHISNSASGGGIAFKTGSGNGHTNATERLRIHYSGRIGIGTNNPDCNLHVMKALCGTVNSDNNSVLSLENGNHCVLQMLSPADKSSYIMFGDPDDVNAGQIRYDQNINSLEFQTNAANVLSFNSNGYHRFHKHPVFVSSVTGVYGTAGSLVSSPASAKAQITSVADNNSNFDSTNHNFVCPVNGYYQITVDVSLGNVGTEDIRRIYVMGYTLGGATGVQSNYVEVLDDKMARYGNYNYSHPWFFTSGTTIAVGINGNSGTINTQTIQLSVFLITATG